MDEINQGTKTEDETIVNGVSVKNLLGTVKAIQENPTIAKFNFRAKGNWVNGGHNRTTINDYYGACSTHDRKQSFVYEKDEPPILLGEDNGATPVEYAFAALNGCLTTSLIYHAAAQGIKIEEVESTLAGNVDLRGFLGMDESIRNGYESINFTFRIKSDAPEEKLRELVDLAQKRSPVFDIISHPTPIKVSMEKKL